MLRKLFKFGRKALAAVWHVGKELFQNQLIDGALSIAGIIFPAAAPAIEAIEGLFSTAEPPDETKVKEAFKSIFDALGNPKYATDFEKAWAAFEEFAGKLKPLSELNLDSDAGKLDLARIIAQFVIREEGKEGGLFYALDKETMLSALSNLQTQAGAAIPVIADDPNKDSKRYLNMALEQALLQSRLNNTIEDLKRIGQEALRGIAYMPKEETVRKKLKALADAGMIPENEAAQWTYERWASDDQFKKTFAALVLRYSLLGKDPPVELFGINLSDKANASAISSILMNLVVEKLVCMEG